MSEAIYPCRDCGVLRTKEQGGTVFTVCDECWNRDVEKHAPLANVTSKLATELAESEARISSLAAARDHAVAELARRDLEVIGLRQTISAMSESPPSRTVLAMSESPPPRTVRRLMLVFEHVPCGTEIDLYLPYPHDDKRPPGIVANEHPLGCPICAARMKYVGWSFDTLVDKF